MVRASRVWTLSREAQESQCEDLCEERPCLRESGSSGTQTPRSRRGDLLPTVDHVCRRERSWMGTARRVCTLVRSPALDRVQANSKQECRPAVAWPVPSASSGHLPVANALPSGLQESENGPPQAGRWSRRLVEVSRAGSAYLALHWALECA